MKCLFTFERLMMFQGCLAIATVILVVKTPVAFGDALFYQEHVRASASVIKTALASGETKRVVIAPRFETNLSDLRAALINSAINPRPLSFEALEKINASLGKSSKDSSCLGDFESADQSVSVMSNAIKSQKIPVTILEAGSRVRPDEILLSSAVTYSPPDSMTLKAWTTKGGETLLHESKKTVKLKPSFFSWIFGSGYGGIKRCLEQRNFVLKLADCQVSGPQKALCKGDLQCRLSTVNNQMESIRLKEADCQSNCSNLGLCLNRLVESGRPIESTSRFSNSEQEDNEDASAPGHR